MGRKDSKAIPQKQGRLILDHLAENIVMERREDLVCLCSDGEIPKSCCLSVGGLWKFSTKKSDHQDVFFCSTFL